ncbi:MAG TPA: hypothetical protein VFV49_03945 [Thermoanaerobaculia bacterium]|nr:hypothetical protein [Thermoanaerobaculia bacterium]
MKAVRNRLCEIGEGVKAVCNRFGNVRELLKAVRDGLYAIGRLTKAVWNRFCGSVELIYHG